MGKYNKEGCTYLSMWKEKWPLFMLCGWVFLLTSKRNIWMHWLSCRMRTTMGYFSSKPLSTKYRQTSQKTSLPPKDPLFCSLSGNMTMTDKLFIYWWQHYNHYNPIHSTRNKMFHKFKVYRWKYIWMMRGYGKKKFLGMQR